MEIIITPASRVRSEIMYHGITHVISLLVSADRYLVRLPTNFNKNNHLFLDMDDTLVPEVCGAPRRDQVEKMLDWVKLLPSDAKLLVHCFAGVSRSTAAALAIKVQELGTDKIDEAIAWLKYIRPVACPNPVITMYADEILCANGELYKKSEDFANAKLIRMLK